MEKYYRICDFCKERKNNLLTYYLDDDSVVPLELDICEDCLKKLTGFKIKGGDENETEENEH